MGYFFCILSKRPSCENSDREHCCNNRSPNSIVEKPFPFTAAWRAHPLHQALEFFSRVDIKSVRNVGIPIASDLLELNTITFIGCQPGRKAVVFLRSTIPTENFCHQGINIRLLSRLYVIIFIHIICNLPVVPYIEYHLL